MTSPPSREPSSGTVHRSRRATHVQSVGRAAALLRAVAAASGPDDATAAALADAVGLNRTTTWRILSTLEQERLVSCDRGTGRYSLGFGLIDLAGDAGGALARSARSVLHRVAVDTGETAALAVMRDGRLTYLAEVSAGAVVSAGWVGKVVPMHATSTGKVLLAFSDTDDVRTLLALPRGARLTRHTARTITTLAALEAELDVIRAQGFAVCRGEFESTAWGVSAPVLDRAGHPAAVLSVWGPGDRLSEDRFPALGRIAVAAAQEIAGRRPA